MNKKAFWIPAAAVAFGVAGYFLRTWELQTGFDVKTGLAYSDAPAHTAVIALSVAAAAIAVLVSALLARKNRFGDTCREAFSARGSFLPLLGAAGGVAIFAGALLYGAGLGGYATVLDLIFAAAAAGSGVVETALAFRCASGKEAGGLGKLSVILPLFFCFWLLLLYKENSTDPVIFDYCFTALALAAVSLSLYYTDGYFFGRERPGAFLFTHLAALYFGVLSLADLKFGGKFLILLGVLVSIFAETILFLVNMSARDENRMDADAAKE